MSLNRLRDEVVAKFRIYSEARPNRRQVEWNDYVRAREDYLRACCQRDFREYKTCADTIVRFNQSAQKE